METQIIDNWLSKDLTEYLNDYFLHRFPHYYGHQSNPNNNENCFYVSMLNSEDALNNFLFYKLKKTLNKNLKLKMRKKLILFKID